MWSPAQRPGDDAVVDRDDDKGRLTGEYPACRLGHLVTRRQVDEAGLQHEHQEPDFAAGWTGRRAGNLPVQLSSFVGGAELADIRALPRADRLVTLTGSGGFGKSRPAPWKSRRRSPGRVRTAVPGWSSSPR
jgi:hypothetical protein